MGRSAAEELLALETQGIDWSRNRNFYLFTEEGPRRALALRQRLSAVSRFIRTHRAHGLTVSRQRVSGPYPIELRLYAPRIAATLVTRLDEAELTLLCRDRDIAGSLSLLA